VSGLGHMTAFVKFITRLYFCSSRELEHFTVIVIIYLHTSSVSCDCFKPIVLQVGHDKFSYRALPTC